MKDFWSILSKAAIVTAVFTFGYFLRGFPDTEPVKAESTVLLEQILHKTDGMVTVQYLDSVLKAKKRAYNHNVLVEHMETCEHKAKSSTAGETTKTE